MKHACFFLILMTLALQEGGAQAVVSAPEGALFTFTNFGSSSQIFFPETEWNKDQGFSFPYRFSNGNMLNVQYFIESNNLRALEYQECPFLFSEQQAAHFKAANCAESISPNGRYIIYPTDEQVCGSESGCSLLPVLGDLETGAYTIIRKSSDVHRFTRWSEDSSAFLILDVGHVAGLGGIWYARVPHPNFSASDLKPVLLANFPFGDIGFVDIAPDGQQVLVRGDGSGRSNGGLSLWDSRLPSSSQQFSAWADGQFILEGERIAGASFVPGNQGQVIVVVEKGIVRYDLETGAAVMLNTEINSRWVDWTYFSSDLSYTLVYDNWPEGKPGQQIALFRLDLQDDLPE